MIIGVFMLSLCRVVVQSVFRANFSLFVFVGLSVLVFLSLIGLQFSARQPAVVALDLSISFIRFYIPLFAVFMVQEVFSREFERRYFLVSFSYPVSRSAFLLGRFVVVWFLLFFLFCVFLSFTAFLVGFFGADYVQSKPVGGVFHYLVWGGFFVMDFTVVLTFCVLVAVVARTTVFLFISVLGFVLISRSYMAVFELLGEGHAVGQVDGYRGGLGYLRFFFPDLGGLDVRGVVLYGDFSFVSSLWVGQVLGVFTYALFLLCVALFFIRWRRF